MSDQAAAPDFPLRHHRLYQWLRRASLLGSWLFILGVPLLHLRALASASGLSTGGAWAQLAHWLDLRPAPPPALGAPWTVNLFGLELLDPLAGLGVLFSLSPSATVLLGLVPTVLLVALLGRFFCGWLCPYRTILAASNALRALLPKAGFVPRDRPLPRRLSLWVLGTVLLLALLAGTQVAPVIYPPAVIARSALRAIILGGLGTGALLIALAFLFDTFVSRAGFCRYLCPGGALMTLIGAVSPVRVVRDAHRCTSCGACDQVCNLLQRPATGQVGAGCERCGLCVAACAPRALRFSLARPSMPALAAPTVEERRLVLGAVPAIAVLAVWGRDVAKPLRLRPPRAAPGRDFAARCIRCQRCAEVCPPRAIRFDGQLDLRGTDTPYIDARLSACTLCMRCTQACPTGALVPLAGNEDLTALQRLVRMGKPILDQKKCLPWNGDGICRACYYACPYPDSA
ncbi:MAG: 4Fe-4S dicluster domain-containing protein, partial [Deltaproteobacteria bacterium]|nr:4Fe-4S dicluster domain-containing protein [Deltaproteobacteria bacterium]